MYVSAKKILSRLVAPDKIMKHEVFLRKAYALFYSGTKHQCTICTKKLSTFLQLPNNDLLCPQCGSLSRDRRLWNILNTGFLKDNVTVLDFSPSRALARKMKKIRNINYISTDLSGNFIADYHYDITDLNVASDSIGLIVCYHVLEHIADDHKAMAELYRVLKPKGRAIIQTPFKEGDIYEDYTITLPADREVHFGQDDHVRVYSVEGLIERLTKAGFKAEATTYNANIYNGLFANETVITLTKP